MQCNGNDVKWCMCEFYCFSFLWVRICTYKILKSWWCYTQRFPATHFRDMHACQFFFTCLTRRFFAQRSYERTSSYKGRFLAIFKITKSLLVHACALASNRRPLIFLFIKNQLGGCIWKLKFTLQLLCGFFLFLYSFLCISHLTKISFFS